MNDYIKKCKTEESITTIFGLVPENPDDIPKISSFLRSICTITAPGIQPGKMEIGTGFIALVPTIGICFFSAGHCIERALKAQSNNTLDELGRCIITFGNLDGKINSQASSELGILKPMSLRSFLERFSYYGSICFKGTLKILKENGGPQEPENVTNKQDYCAILLRGSYPQDAKNTLNSLGLSYLECGQEDYLDYKDDGIVQIVGHPAIPNRDDQPMRISPGHEKGAIDDKLYVDYDSLAGASGAPVLGRGHKSSQPGMDQAYKVKAIHIKGKANSGSDIEKNYNCAQSIKNVHSWIKHGQ